tara:strand:+ start:412 stop:795 length:384 start_codon:yes stop_codon:yes gene_type:complete
MILDIDVIDHIPKFYKPKRNDKKRISVYESPTQFYMHYTEDVLICLTDNVYHVGCYGNQQKLNGVSTCHAFLIGCLMAGKIIKDKTDYEDVFYDKENAKIVGKYGDLEQGDFILITTDNKVYRLDKE